MAVRKLIYTITNGKKLQIRVRYGVILWCKSNFHLIAIFQPRSVAKMWRGDSKLVFRINGREFGWWRGLKLINLQYFEGYPSGIYLLGVRGWDIGPRYRVILGDGNKGTGTTSLTSILFVDFECIPRFVLVFLSLTLSK